MTIITGDCRESLGKIKPGSVQACITSPPYFGLRDYGHDEQLGLEQTPDEYVANMVEVFRGVRDALADDGTLWLNLGDSYAGSNKGVMADGLIAEGEKQRTSVGTMNGAIPKTGIPEGLKPKDIIGIPWRLAFALQADGWWLRQDIIWVKPNPMPESVTDRCTKSHEYLFLLTKRARYYYDHDAIKEPAVATNFHDYTGTSYQAPGQSPQTGNRKSPRFGGDKYGDSDDPKHATKSGNEYQFDGTRNKRDVWTIPTKPFRGAHFAVMPEALVEPCILAGSRQGDTVLDPFAGSGTVGVVAKRHARRFIGCELNPEYAAMAEGRIMNEPESLFMALEGEK